MINWDKISQEESIYRLGLKRYLARKGIPREVTRNFETEELERFNI